MQAVKFGGIDMEITPIGFGSWATLGDNEIERIHPRESVEGAYELPR